MRALLLSILFLLCVPQGLAHAASASALAQELIRSRQDGQRVMSFWWLPMEYWEASARELKKPAEELDTIRKLFRNYLIIGVLDTAVRPDGSLDPATHSDIGPRLEVLRNGARVEILRDVDRRVARRISELSYLLKTSLSIMGPALRIFFLPNVDDQGRPILQGASTGELRISYARGEETEPLELFWHAPLTSVVGAARCPEGGERLEAHWLYCPWHGVKVK